MRMCVCVRARVCVVCVMYASARACLCACAWVYVCICACICMSRPNMTSRYGVLCSLFKSSGRMTKKNENRRYQTRPTSQVDMYARTRVHTCACFGIDSSVSPSSPSAGFALTFRPARLSIIWNHFLVNVCA